MQSIRNIPYAEVFAIAAQVEYLPGQIASRTLAQNEHHSLTLFAFDKGEEIGSHDSEGDALVLALDGEGSITIGGKRHVLKAGEAVVMPAAIPHAVFANERFKMLLTVIFKP